MNIKEAVNVLIQGVELGRKNAVYTFDDAAIISQAIHVLTDNNPLESFVVNTPNKEPDNNLIKTKIIDDLTKDLAKRKEAGVQKTTK